MDIEIGDIVTIDLARTFGGAPNLFYEEVIDVEGELIGTIDHFNKAKWTYNKFSVVAVVKKKDIMINKNTYIDILWKLSN